MCWGRGVLRAILYVHLCLQLGFLSVAISNYICSSLSAIRFSLCCNSVCSSSLFWPFKRPKRCRFTGMYIYKKRGRVNRVLPGQLLSGFLLRHGPVPGPGRPGPGPVQVSKLWV